FKSFLFGLSAKRRIVNSDWRIRVLPYSLPATRNLVFTIFLRRGGFPSRRSRRSSAVGRAANRRPRLRPAASGDRGYRVRPCPKAVLGVPVPRRYRRRNR